MFQFATAWVAPAGTVGTEECQVLVYLAQEPGVIRAHHRCITNGVYMEWSMKWEDEDKWTRANEYFAAAKVDGETRENIQGTFAAMEKQAWPIP